MLIVRSKTAKALDTFLLSPQADGIAQRIPEVGRAAMEHSVLTRRSYRIGRKAGLKLDSLVVVIINGPVYKGHISAKW